MPPVVPRHAGRKSFIAPPYGGARLKLRNLWRGDERRRCEAAGGVGESPHSVLQHSVLAHAILSRGLNRTARTYPRALRLLAARAPEQLGLREGKPRHVERVRRNRTPHPR